MKVMVIVKASAASERGEMPSEELLTAMGNFNEELVKAGIMQAGEGLHPSSKGVRVAFSGKNRTVIDGPFAETKELIAGFWMWQVKSMEEAIAWAKRCPNPHEEPCEIEIRPVFSADDFGAEFTPQLREQEASIRAQTLGLGAIRFEQGRALSLAGLDASYNKETVKKIPAQWDRFLPHLGKVPGQQGHDSFGVCHGAEEDCSFQYLTGVEVAADAKLPADFQRVDVPAGRYAVFTHTGPVATLPAMIDTLWSKWAPECGLRLKQSPCYERYTANFDPEHGGTEIWVPLEG